MDKHARKCDSCGDGMFSGYVDAGSTYCSDECLIKENQKNGHTPNYSMKDWARDHEENEDECYWTQWDEVDEDEWFNAEGVRFTTEFEWLLYHRLKETHKAIDSFTDESKNPQKFSELLGLLAENETVLKSFEDGNN